MYGVYLAFVEFMKNNRKEKWGVLREEVDDVDAHGDRQLAL
jgi:hypothetical protein